MKTTIILLTLLISGSLYAAKGGSNIGGGNNGSEYLATWCKNQSSLLRNYRDRAVFKVNNTGDYALSNKILVDGMIQALKALNTDNNSFLAKSLARGLEISKNLQATNMANAERKAMIINNVLLKQYEFMIETVAKNLDIGAFIPYVQSSEEAMDVRAAHFEETFVTYANAQLNWILEELTAEARLGNKVIVTPVGDAKSLIKVAIILSEGTASDLNESLWNYRFSCAISDLNILNQTLIAYDQGNREMFDDEKSAVTYLSQELKRISRTLTLKSSCN
jgi:hypothetical protein